jgi:hypothetical protein
MREGEITSLCEHGVDDDAGTYRLTFFHRNRGPDSSSTDRATLFGARPLISATAQAQARLECAGPAYSIPGGILIIRSPDQRPPAGIFRGDQPISIRDQFRTLRPHQGKSPARVFSFIEVEGEEEEPGETVDLVGMAGIGNK